MLYRSPSDVRRGMGDSPLTNERVYSSEETLNVSFDPLALRKVPTGIADLDSIVGGGFPEGSLVLLLGDIGAGTQEYVYTAASKIAIVPFQNLGSESRSARRGHTRSTGAFTLAEAWILIADPHAG